MTETLAVWWRLRTRREQGLLLVMLALLALVAAWLLVVRPLDRALEEAKARHDQAIAELADARARAALAGRFDRPARLVSPPRPILDFVRRSAIEAGFANARITERGPDAILVMLDSARPPAAFAWLRQLQQNGIEVATLRARANPDRTLGIEAILEAAGR